MKLGFINGKLLPPDEESKGYEAWLKYDLMVTSWIVNAILKDFREQWTTTLSNSKGNYLDFIRAMKICTCNLAKIISDMTN
ncbi:conserved hypothetical protein [Ricinus communis]|uniref:Retrotransposon Copia-like N-terminal domain-containing protein n=1 Tax=Ricinus communis TaxID=3988 RepID=B9SK71_RICCO|nr:conserved hypothetical protein [Ricinus communis]